MAAWFGAASSALRRHGSRTVLRLVPRTPARLDGRLHAAARRRPPSASASLSRKTLQRAYSCAAMAHDGPVPLHGLLRTAFRGTSGQLGRPPPPSACVCSIRTRRRAYSSGEDRPHRLPPPTKQELLAAASGFWERWKIRFKFATVRQYRPYNADEIGALFSWVILGHILWIVVGTTTFVSLILLAVNTLSAQEHLAKIVGQYLTRETGMTVIFESAIVPKWRDGTISFKNVFVSRRPKAQQDSAVRVRKGSSATAAAAAAAAAVTEHGAQDNISPGTLARAAASDVDNYSQFDLTIESVDVTLSFIKWINGRGVLKNVAIRGVRGVLDRTSVSPSSPDVDPLSLRHVHTAGDFEIEKCTLDDLLVTVYQPDLFRPFTVSIFSCDLPQLRKQWFFYDILCANTISGCYDNSLFTIHPRQSFHHNDEDSTIKASRLRIDNLNVDHLNRGVSGPLGWITQGTVDVIADMFLPQRNENNLAQIVNGVVDSIEGAFESKHGFFGSNSVLGPPNAESRNSTPTVQMNIIFKLSSARAAVPLFTQDLSYMKNALIRPIVVYINSKNTMIPVSCRVLKDLEEFNGSWTAYDSGLMRDVSMEIYNAFARNVADENLRRKRFKQVGGFMVQSLFRYLANSQLRTTTPASLLAIGY